MPSNKFTRWLLNATKAAKTQTKMSPNLSENGDNHDEARGDRDTRAVPALMPNLRGIGEKGAAAITWLKDSITEEAAAEIFNTNDVISNDEELSASEGDPVECHTPADDPRVSGTDVLVVESSGRRATGFKDFGGSRHVEGLTTAGDPLYWNNDAVRSPRARFDDYWGFCGFGREEEPSYQRTHNLFYFQANAKPISVEHHWELLKIMEHHNWKLAGPTTSNTKGWVDYIYDPPNYGSEIQPIACHPTPLSKASLICVQQFVEVVNREINEEVFVVVKKTHW